MSEQVVAVSGRQLRVRIRPGTAAGPPLVLCNGIGARLEVLEPLVSRLRPARTVITFDVPGVGESPTPPRPYTVRGLARLLAELLTHLGFGEVDILGYSWGGGLAQQFAVQYPRRARRLVLACTGTGMLMVPGHPRVLSRMLTSRRHHDPEYAASVAADLYGGSMRTNPELARGILGGRHDRPRSLGYLYQLGALLTWTSLPWLWAVRQPTLLIFGDDDPLIPLANGYLMNAVLPHGELYTFHGGHLDPVLLAPQIAGEIDRFLS